MGQFENTPAPVTERRNCWWFFKVNGPARTERLALVFENDRNTRSTSIYEVKIFASSDFSGGSAKNICDCTPVISDDGRFFIRNRGIFAEGNEEGLLRVASSSVLAGDEWPEDTESLDSYLFRTRQIDVANEPNKWRVESESKDKWVEPFPSDPWHLRLQGGGSDFNSYASEQRLGDDGLYHRFNHVYGGNATDFHWGQRSSDLLNKLVNAKTGNFWDRRENIDHTEWLLIKSSFKCLDYLGRELAVRRVLPPRRTIFAHDDTVVMFKNFANGKFLYRATDHRLELRELISTTDFGRFKWKVIFRGGGKLVFKNFEIGDNLYVNDNGNLRCDDGKGDNKEEWRLAPSPDLRDTWHIGHRHRNVKLRHVSGEPVIDLNADFEGPNGLPTSINNQRHEWLIMDPNAALYEASAPKASFTVTLPTGCGATNGSINLTFEDHPDRTGIEFSIDGGVTWEPTLDDEDGSVTYGGQSFGSTDVYVRWGNNSYPTFVGTAEFPVDGLDPPCDTPPTVTYMVNQPTSCTGDDGTVTFSFSTHPNRTQVSFGFDDVGWSAPINLSDGSATFDVPLGPLELWARWGNGDVPTHLNEGSPIVISTDSIDPPCDAPPEADYVVLQPMLCDGSDGAVTFTFSTHPRETHVQFGFDGLRYLDPVPLSDGSVTYNVPLGPLQLWARWGDGDSPTQLNADDPIVISIDGIDPPCGAPPEVEWVVMQPTRCDGTDGSITFTFEEHPRRSHLEIGFSETVYFPPVPLSDGSVTYGVPLGAARHLGPVAGWRVENSLKPRRADLHHYGGDRATLR